MAFAICYNARIEEGFGCHVDIHVHFVTKIPELLVVENRVFALYISIV